MTKINFNLAILLLLLPFPSINSHRLNGPEFCDQTAECVAKVRRMAQESNRFWFGDQWQFNCGGHGHHHHQQQHKDAGGGSGRARAGRQQQGNPLDCLNPPELAPFASLGSRLFRVHTFTPAYLANLRIFPRIHFQPRTGFYRACSHNFEVTVGEEERLFGFSGHPLARPIPAFQAQPPPDLNWPELHANQSMIVLMLDIGWGQLAYLATDFPRDTKVLAKFHPVDNFRPQQPTPLAMLIIEMPEAKEDEAKSIMAQMEAKWTAPPPDRREHFNLGQFMLDHRLERRLIGLNWALIDADPFAIEKQRLRGMPDNCHALVLQKLIADHRWHFVHTFGLSNELDSSLSVSLPSPGPITVNVCCHSAQIASDQPFFLDPLADQQQQTEVPSIGWRHNGQPPTITSMRPMGNVAEPAYQRASRHYVVFQDDRFTLLLFDPDANYLYWLMVDIPGDGLAGGTFQDAITVADYLPPIPAQPGECHFAVFMLFRQPKAADPLGEFFDRDHPLRHAQCQAQKCKHRANFSVEQFKALHRLHLSAINWARVCFDLFEASHQISLLRKRPEIAEGIDRTAKTWQIADGKRSKKGTTTTTSARNGNGNELWDRANRERQIAAICAHFAMANVTDANGNDDEQRDCPLTTTNGSGRLAQFRAAQIWLPFGTLLLALRMATALQRRQLFHPFELIPSPFQ